MEVAHNKDVIKECYLKHIIERDLIAKIYR